MGEVPLTLSPFWGDGPQLILGLSRGGIAPSLQEKRERLQNKRTQRPDGAGLKQFPCKRFKEVGRGPQSKEGIPKICRGSVGIEGGSRK